VQRYGSSDILSRSRTVMKDITLIRRIEEARQLLEQLSDLRNDPLRSEMRQAVDLVSGVLSMKSKRLL
jgi:hypothetical protein